MAKALPLLLVAYDVLNELLKERLKFDLIPPALLLLRVPENDFTLVTVCYSFFLFNRDA